MTRWLGIVAAFVLTLGLASIKAEAQQVFACVNNSSRVQFWRNEAKIADISVNGRPFGRSCGFAWQT